MFTIYAILDTDGAIAYIGQTNDLNRRQGEHKRDFRKPLYSWLSELDNVELLPLAYADTRQESLEREQYYVDLYTAMGHDLKNSLLTSCKRWS